MVEFQHTGYSVRPSGQGRELEDEGQDRYVTVVLRTQGEGPERLKKQNPLPASQTSKLQGVYQDFVSVPILVSDLVDTLYPCQRCGY